MQSKPALKDITVFGVVAGQTTKLTLTGENLAPSAVSVKGPVQAKLLDVKPTTIIVEVTPAPDCPAESFELTLVHPKDSLTLKLPVLLAVAQEMTVKKPLNRFSEAMLLVPKPSVAIQTNLENDQPHLYGIALKAGESIAITVTGARSPLSELDPILRVRDPQRLCITMATGSIKRDRRVVFRAHSDGLYYLEISDAQQRSGAKFLYRLTVRRL